MPAAGAFWAGQVGAGGTGLGGLASGIFESPERLDPIVGRMYRDYLFREPDADGLAFWRGIWQRDGGPENVVAGIISSPEFFRSAGGTNHGWVTELYRRLLGRDPDGGGLDYWTGQLEQELRTRPAVVLGFVRSPENFRNLVRGWHGQYLNRAPTAQEENAFVAQLLAGASQRSIQIQILDGAEYFNTPPPPPAGAARRV